MFLQKENGMAWSFGPDVLQHEPVPLRYIACILLNSILSLQTNLFHNLVVALP